MPTSISLSIRCECLLERMKLECKLKVLKMKHDHLDMDENAFYCTQDACACILNIQNRVSIACLQILLIEGHSNCEDAILNSDVSRLVLKKFKSMLKMLRML